MLKLDIELEVLNSADQISGPTTDAFAVQGAAFLGVKATAQFVTDWEPDLGGDDEN